MPQDDIMQIKVDKYRVGILGLRHVMEEMAKDYAEKPDGEAQTELLKPLSRKNYIPDRVKGSYGKVFLREFKRFLGKPHDEEILEGLEIKVLGPGCIQCNRLERELMEVMAEMNLAGDIEHVADISEIGRYGVMGTPQDLAYKMTL
jgi:hypothetical protein